MSAAEVQAHHRLRGGIPQDTIRALNNDFGMIHAPVQSFPGNWLYRHATALGAQRRAVATQPDPASGAPAASGYAWPF